MSRPLRVEYEGAAYHVIQRGIERKAIFRCDKDKEKFLMYLISAYKKKYRGSGLYIPHNNLVICIKTPIILK